MSISMSRSTRRSGSSAAMASGPISGFYSSGGAGSIYSSGGASTAFASSSSSSFSAAPPSFFHRSASPTRVNLVGSSPPRKSPAVRVSSPAGRPSAASAAFSAARSANTAAPRRTCMCSPTTHPGSFRCSLHKNAPRHNHHHQVAGANSAAVSHRLYARRSAMTNSLVRIGTVEGDLVKRALAALIRPSSHQQRRRGEFQPRPSRLSAVQFASANDNRC